MEFKNISHEYCETVEILDFPGRAVYHDSIGCGSALVVCGSPHHFLYLSECPVSEVRFSHFICKREIRESKKYW